MNINELFKKYYMGETTLEEEKIIADFLMKENIPDEFTVLKLHFFFNKQEKADVIKSGNFDNQIFERINIIPKYRKIIIMKKFKYFVAAAAIVLLFIGYYFFNQLNNTGKGVVITDANLKENRKIAIAETKKALSLITSKLELVSGKMEKLNYIDKGIKDLKKLEKLPK